MLLPIGPMNMDLYEEQVEPPPEVRNKHVHFWRVLLLFFVGLFVLQILAVDIFGAVFTGVMGIIVWYMVSNRCLQMSQYCLFMFGLLCVIQTIFESITLLTMVGGRRIERTTDAQTASSAGGRSTSVTFTRVIEVHPFFDGTQSFRYNVQSAMRICSPVVMLIAGLLAYWSYNVFPTGLFSYREDEIRPMVGSGGRLGSGGHDYGGGPVGGARPQQGDHSTPHGGGHPVGRQEVRGPRLFEGSGQRLGGR